MAAGGGTLTAAAQPQQPPLPPTPSTAGGGIKSTVLDGWRAFRSALGLHTKEFGELVSLVDGTHLWRCLTLPCSGAASSRSFHEFVGLLGLSNSVNWVLFYLYIWGYATSSLKFDWALVLVPPWNPLSATMIMYWLFEKAGHGGQTEFSRERFSKAIYGALLALYFAFHLCWFVIAVVRGTDINDGLCVDVNDVQVCSPDTGSGWGIIVVCAGCLNFFIAICTCIVGLKHLLSDTTAADTANAKAAGATPVAEDKWTQSAKPVDLTLPTYDLPSPASPPKTLVYSPHETTTVDDDGAAPSVDSSSLVGRRSDAADPPPAAAAATSPSPQQQQQQQQQQLRGAGTGGAEEGSPDADATAVAAAATAGVSADEEPVLPARENGETAAAAVDDASAVQP